MANQAMRVVSLFSGIGGIEKGLGASAKPLLFCESDPTARAVLEREWPSVPIAHDVADLHSIPKCDLVTAGFPCQDLSQQGLRKGIGGARSGLVQHLFRLLRESTPDVLIENVPFLLRLEQGRAMSVLVNALEDLGYLWAYRVIDVRAFAVHQRRKRVLLYASTSRNPAAVLLSADAGDPAERRDMSKGIACGFSWTEGKTGLGWAVDAVPTIKVGSGLGIPSPPAVVTTDHKVVTIGIETAEALQGFRPGYTTSNRWRLIGNAVHPAMTEWFSAALQTPGQITQPSSSQSKWPNAAYGARGQITRVSASTRPVQYPWVSTLQDKLTHIVPMTARQRAGFLRRARAGRLRFPKGFLELVESAS